MSIVTAAGTMDFNGWIRGLVGAAISGGASAVTGAIVLPALDAKDFNVYTSHFYVAIFALFLANALVSVSKFLAAAPLPSLKEVTTTIQKTTPATPETPKVVETVTEVHVEPIPKL